MTPVGALAITAIVACGAPCLVAQPRPETPHPEWTGHYQIVRGRELGDLKMINPELDEVVIAHLQPWARAKMEATDGVADDTGAVCQPFGLFLYPPSAQFSGFLWLPTPEKIVMVYGPLQINTTGVQRIYLNRASHPANLLPTWNGDSVGRWEGDTLVVDTIGFNSKSWLQPGMEPHSEETHMIQRFRRLDNGFLEIQTTIEDRVALTSAYMWSRYFRKIGTDAPENVCADYLQVWKDWRNKALDTQLQRSRIVR